jgi:hypothetical protein
LSSRLVINSTIGTYVEINEVILAFFESRLFVKRVGSPIDVFEVVI